MNPIAMKLAHALVQARISRVPVPKPPGLDLALATVVRSATIAMLTGDSPPAAYKVSLSTGTWGALPVGAIVPNGACISRSAFIDPLLEPEILFRVDSLIAPGADVEAILHACSVTPGIELADSRWEGWRPSVGQRFVAPDAAQIEANNTMSGMLVVGSPWLPAREMPLERLTIALHQGGRVRSQGHLREVMGGPAHAVHWLIGIR